MAKQPLKSKQFTVRVEDQLHNDFILLAEVLSTTPSQLIRKMIIELTNKHHKRK